MAERIQRQLVALPSYKRWTYFGIGWGFFGLGVLGAFLPVLPTTPLMIVALWAFTKSSERFQHWLYNHAIFGPPLQRWIEYQVIPNNAKMAAIGAMTVSLAYLFIFTTTPIPVLVGTTALMLGAAWYILSKPSDISAVKKKIP